MNFEHLSVEQHSGAATAATDSVMSLVVQRGPDAGRRFLLAQPVTSAGRHPHSDIFLDDITVGRRHAEFRLIEGGECRIVDGSSLTGTYVNREPTSSTVLHDGDEIRLGRYQVVFRNQPVSECRIT